MFGRFYTTREIYSFTNKTELLDILELDQIGRVTFEEKQIVKTIEYEIENQLCIRLSDLLYLIECRFVKFHLAQLLILLQKIIEKVNQLEQHKLKHEFLDTSRIWLKMKSGSECVSIIYALLEYEIHFTGYQCPIYEGNQKYEQNMEVSISNIIIETIELCQGKIKVKVENALAQNYFYQPIIESCKNKNLQETLTIIKSLLTNVDKTNQTIPGFDEKEAGLKRRLKVRDVEKEMTVIIGNQKNREPLLLELTYFQAVPFLALKLRNLVYSSQQFDSAKVLVCYENRQNIVRNSLQQQDGFVSNIIQRVFKTIFFQIESTLKLQDLEAEKGKMISETVKQVMNLKILRYFENSIWMYLSDEQNFGPRLQTFISQNVYEISEKQCNLFYQNKILELINELI